MRYIVCVKEVPESNKVKIDNDNNRVIYDKETGMINPFDQFMLEEALKIKKGGDEVLVISIGSLETRTTLLKCLALGADKAILLSDNAFLDSDTFGISYTLAKAIDKIGDYTIIFCGQQSFDCNTSQVGPELAAHLKIPQITNVEEIQNIEEHKVQFKAQTDEGYKILEVELPVLVAGIPPSSFQPSLPPMRNIFAAQKKPFSEWKMDDIDIDKEKWGDRGMLIKIINIYPTPPREKGTIISDEPQIAVDKLVEILNKDKVI
jgi:electron transfer flavoprotein beta subunit